MRELGRQMARAALTRARTECATDREFELEGRRWWSPSGVVGSAYNTSTGLFARWLPVDRARSMLEMGCGCGVAAVTGALAGVEHVVAVDVNPRAVAATAANAERHDVGEAVRAVHSDLFDALAPDERFDLVFWNSPFIDAEYEREDADDHMVDHFFDPGYVLHRRFLAELPSRLTDDGRAFLGFSAAMAEAGELSELASEHGLTVTPFRRESFAVPHAELGDDAVFRAAAGPDGTVEIDFSMLELIR